MMATAPGASAEPIGTVTEFPAGNDSFPLKTAAGPDGNLWYTGAGAGGGIGRITPTGTITEFSAGITGATVSGIAAGPDGNLWFTEGADRIGRITPTGTVTEFSAGITARSIPADIAAGPDGNLWFTESEGNRIGRITPTGTVTEFSAGITARSYPIDIAAGPDGNLWFTEGANRIGRITPTGTVTEFTANGGPMGIAAGPDGNLWFTEAGGNRIGRITPTGTITEFSAGITAGSYPFDIAAGPDGNLWFTEVSGSRIGRITPTGTVTEFSAGSTAESQPAGIAVGADGSLWFAEGPGHRIGRIASQSTAAPTVATRRSSSVTKTSATLNATVNPEGAEVTECYFEYGSFEHEEQTTFYGSSVPCSSLPGAGASAVGVSAPVAGLTRPFGVYDFRVVAMNSFGTSYGDNQMFVAEDPPTAVTEAASPVGHESATLNATVNPNGPEVTDCRFEYGSTTSYGSSIPCSSLPGAGESAVGVTAALTGLSANVVHHFRIVATNAAGPSFGADQLLVVEGAELAEGEPFPQVESKGSTPGAIEVRNPPGTTVTEISVEEVGLAGLPAGAVQVVGGVSYQLSGFPAGSSFDAVFNLPPGSEPTNVYKRINGTYVDVTSLATISANTITFHVRDGGPGDEDGVANGVIVDPFVPVWLPAPVVRSASPVGGSTAGGTSVTISGVNLTGATSVKFGAMSAASFQVNSPTSLTAVSPAGTGTVNITVTTPEGTSTTSSADQFNYALPPTVTKLTGNKGPAGGGTTVTITGSHLTGATAVRFASSNAASFTVNSPTSITAVSPAGTTGTVDVTVTTRGGTSAATSKDHFKYANPTVTSVSPNSGSKGAGTPVTVTGSGFALGSATAFKFGKTAGTSVNCTTTTTCAVVSPAAAKIGTVDVRATSGGKTSKKNPSGDQYTYN
jgi:streptogramin lyase